MHLFIDMNFNGKKLFLIGFIVVLLVGIPATVFLLQQQQETRSRAEKSTNLTFTPESSDTAPIQKKVGEAIALDVNVDPGQNLVSFVKLQIQYDPAKLATASANAFQANTVAFPSVLEGPIYSSGKIEVTLSVGPDPTKAIQEAVKAATITFTALSDTPPGTPTLVTYGITTQVLSIGSNDQASENVLANAAPATIEIGAGAITGTPADIPTGSPTPTVEVPTTAPTATGTPAPTTETPSATPTPTGTGGGGGDGDLGEVPVCNSLTLDRESSGNAPFSITFTANGADSDDTVSKATFNFGDGQVSDVTAGGGIGTNSVNVQISHTYNNAGTYQASAVLTDAASNVSDSGACQQTITVTASGSATLAPATPTVANGTPTPTMVPTGPLGLTIGLGAAALFLMIAGGLIFFAL